MKYSITIADMTADELVTVTAFLNSHGATATTPASPKVRQTVNELAAATGAAPNPWAQYDNANGPTPTPPLAPTPPVQAVPAHAFPTPPVQVAPPVLGTPAPTPPVQTAPPAPTPPGAPEVDVRNIPWTAQFYADSKRQNKNGTWARRKGVDAAACDAYEAGFVGAGPAPAAPTPPAAPQPTAAQVTAQFAPHLAPPALPAAPDPIAAAVPPAPTGIAPVEPVEYTTWHSLYLSLMSSGKLTSEKYIEIANRYGAIEDKMKFFNDEDARARSFLDLQALGA